MALYQPDILQHNNPNLAISDSDFVKGGFRTAVAVKTDLYALSGKTDEPSAAGQLKEYATIVYVTGETTYYILKDVNNVDNENGWEEFQTGGGVGTITGATNGLTLAGVSGATVILGGNLTGSTTIDGLGVSDFTFNQINDFQIAPSGSSNITFGIDETGLLYTFTGGSISYDTNQGVVYGGDYSTDFISESLVSKRYVDTIAAGLHPKTAVLVATTGESINLSTGGLLTVDGLVVQNGDRVLVKNQSSGSENGIYVASASTWTRSTDFDGNPEGEVEQGALIPVITGGTLQNSQWILITKDPVVGVSALTFTLFSSGAYVAGTGIDISGNVISVDDSVYYNKTEINSYTGITDTLIGTKLNISDFTTFTGTTLPANYYNKTEINSYTGITDTLIGTKLDISNFNTFTGTTLPANYYNKTEINSYTGATETEIGLKPNRTDFVGSGNTDITISGDTIIINSENGTIITGATNGLGLINGDTTVALGGALTGDTEINTNGFGVILGTSNNISTGANSLAVGTWTCASGDNSFAGGYGHGGYGDFRVYATGDNSFAFQNSGGGDSQGVSGNDSVILGGEGHVVTSNCAGVFGGRSHCVRTIQGAILGGFNNEICSGNTNAVVLGGASILVETACALGNHAIVPSLAIWSAPSAGDSADVLLAWDSTDKKVKCVSQSTVGVTTATNGVCVDGTNFVLGGDLTGATTIDLCDNGLRLQSDTTSCGLADFNLNTTYADSSFGVCSNDASGAQWGLFGNSVGVNTHHCSNASNGSSITISDTGLTLSNKSSGASTTIILGNSGLIYGNDYHTNYVDRSLIDKEYLDIELSGTSNVVNVHLPTIGTGYTTQRYDDLIPVSGISSNQIYLSSTPVLGQRVIIVDVCGNAFIEPIIINGNGNNINNGVCSTINTDYGSITFIWNNYFWSAVSFIN